MLFILMPKRKCQNDLRERLQNKLNNMLKEKCLFRLVSAIAPGCTLIEMTFLPSAAHRAFSSLLNRTLASLDSPYL